MKPKYNVTAIRDSINTENNRKATESIKKRQEDFERKLKAKQFKNLRILNQNNE